MNGGKNKNIKCPNERLPKRSGGGASLLKIPDSHNSMLAARAAGESRPRLLLKLLTLYELHQQGIDISQELKEVEKEEDEEIIRRYGGFKTAYQIALERGIIEEGEGKDE